LIAVPDASVPAAAPPVPELAAALLETDDSLFVAAVVPLLIFNAAAAASAPDAATRLSGARRRTFEHLYTAACALRNYWRTRLTLAGITHDVPDLYSRELDLPRPDDHYGERCLSAIAERFERGEAGLVIRGMRIMTAHLMDQAFGIAARGPIVAPAG
jgi:hypothetical protein